MIDVLKKKIRERQLNFLNKKLESETDRAEHRKKLRAVKEKIIEKQKIAKDANTMSGAGKFVKGVGNTFQKIANHSAQVQARDQIKKPIAQRNSNTVKNDIPEFDEMIKNFKVI